MSNGGVGSHTDYIMLIPGYYLSYNYLCSGKASYNYTTIIIIVSLDYSVLV